MTDPREIIARAIDPERWAAIDDMNPGDIALPVLIAAPLMQAGAVVEALRQAGLVIRPAQVKRDFW